MSDWKRELKKEEKRDEIRYAKRKRKEAIEKSLQEEMKGKETPVERGALKSVGSDLKHVEETLKDVVLKHGKKKNRDLK